MSHLTIAQLKEKLSERNVPFEEGKLKKYYIDLFESNSKPGSSASISDDEEPSRLASPRGRRSIRGQAAPSTPQKQRSQSDEDEPDDNTLRMELTKRGHTPGPITASTRTLYMRMLRESIKNESSGTPKKAASAASTPSKKTKTKPLLMSDDEEADGTTPAPSPSRRSRSSSTRRRSEVDKLRIDNPGPKIAEFVPIADEGHNTRSRRHGNNGDSSQEQSRDASTPSKVTRGADAGGSCNEGKRNLMMLLFLILIAAGAYFALQNGINLPKIPSRK